MSLAYFWDSFDHLMAVTVQFNDAMNALDARYLMRNNRHLANSVGFVREEIQYITVSLTRQFKRFDQNSRKCSHHFSLIFQQNKAVGSNPLHGLWRYALWFDSKNKHHATAFRRGLSGYAQIGGIHYVGHGLRHRAYCDS